MPVGNLGRFAAPAQRVLVVLRRGPAGAVALLEAIRALDGPIGPATLVGALARLERASLIERVALGRRPVYRLASHTKEAGGWIES